MMIFDASIKKWRQQTEADRRYSRAVIKEAFPTLIITTKQSKEK